MAIWVSSVSLALCAFLFRLFIFHEILCLGALHMHNIYWHLWCKFIRRVGAKVSSSLTGWQALLPTPPRRHIHPPNPATYQWHFQQNAILCNEKFEVASFCFSLSRKCHTSTQDDCYSVDATESSQRTPQPNVRKHPHHISRPHSCMKLISSMPPIFFRVTCSPPYSEGRTGLPRFIWRFWWQHPCNCNRLRIFSVRNGRTCPNNSLSLARISFYQPEHKQHGRLHTRSPRGYLGTWKSPASNFRFNEAIVRWPDGKSTLHCGDHAADVVEAELLPVAPAKPRHVHQYCYPRHLFTFMSLMVLMVVIEAVTSPGY